MMFFELFLPIVLLARTGAEQLTERKWDLASLLASTKRNTSR